MLATVSSCRFTCVVMCRVEGDYTLLTHSQARLYFATFEKIISDILSETSGLKITVRMFIVQD